MPRILSYPSLGREREKYIYIYIYLGWVWLRDSRTKLIPNIFDCTSGESAISFATSDKHPDILQEVKLSLSRDSAFEVLS